MTCRVCQRRPAPVSGQSDKCAECRKDIRRENEALSRAIWGAVWRENNKRLTRESSIA